MNRLQCKVPKQFYEVKVIVKDLISLIRFDTIPLFVRILESPNCVVFVQRLSMFNVTPNSVERTHRREIYH